MIHVLSDDPDGNEQIEDLKRRIGDEQLRQLNTTLCDGQKVTVDELVAACEAMPFLSERRLVLVRGLLSRFERRQGRTEQRKDDQDGDDQQAPELVLKLREYLPGLPPTTELVFLEPSALTKQNPLHKALVTAGARLAQTPPMRGAALAMWIERRVTMKGGRLAAGAANLLASCDWGSLHLLDRELDKLVAYAGSAEVDAPAIKQLVDAARDLSVFRLCDAIAEGNAGWALQQLRELLNEGQHPLYLLSMIVRHFRLLIQVKDMLEGGLRVEGIAATLRLRGFAVERLIRQLHRYRAFERLGWAYDRLLECDEQFKTGRLDVVLNLELLIVELGQRH